LVISSVGVEQRGFIHRGTLRDSLGHGKCKTGSKEIGRWMR
jgi:hypothetical protein